MEGVEPMAEVDSKKRKAEEAEEEDQPPRKKQKGDYHCSLTINTIMSDYTFDPDLSQSDSDDDEERFETFDAGDFEENSKEDDENYDFTWSAESLTDFFAQDVNKIVATEDIHERIMAAIHMEELSLFEKALDFLNRMDNKMAVYLHADPKGMIFLHRLLRNQLPAQWFALIVAKNSKEDVTTLVNTKIQNTGDTALHDLFRHATQFPYLEEIYNTLVVAGADPLVQNNEGVLPIHKMLWMPLYHWSKSDDLTKFARNFKSLLNEKSAEGKTAIYYLEKQRNLMMGDTVDDYLYDDDNSVSEDMNARDDEWVERYQSEVELEDVQEFSAIVETFRRESVALEDFSNFNETFHVSHHTSSEWMSVKLEEKNTELTTLFDFLTKSMGSHLPLFDVFDRYERYSRSFPSERKQSEAHVEWDSLHTKDNDAHYFVQQDLFLRKNFFLNPPKDLEITDQISDISGRTLLHEICIRNSDDNEHAYDIESLVTQFLDKFPAEINRRDKDGNTPLHLALTGFGADLSILNNAGDTPLITAAEHNISPFTMKLLLEKVTDNKIFDVVNDVGNNIAHYLCDDVFCSLESYGHYLHHPTSDGTEMFEEYTELVLANLQTVYNACPQAFAKHNDCMETPIDLFFEALLDETFTKQVSEYYNGVNGARLNDQTDKIEIMKEVVLSCDWLMQLVAPQYQNYYDQLSDESKREETPQKYLELFNTNHNDHKKSIVDSMPEKKHKIIVDQHEISISAQLLTKCEYLKAAFQWAKSDVLELQSIRSVPALHAVIDFMTYGSVPSLTTDEAVIAEIVEICNVWDIPNKGLCYYSLTDKFQQPTMKDSTDDINASDSPPVEAEADDWSTWTKKDMFFEDFAESVFNGAKMIEKPVILGQYIVRDALSILQDFKTDSSVCLDGLKPVQLACEELLVNYFKVLRAVQQKRLEREPDSLVQEYTREDLEKAKAAFKSMQRS